jgi:DNA helicase-2/ATP-dependent DNA helicase PcrA
MIETGAAVLGRMVLNEAQRRAVIFDDGPQLVFAGAGTGKTRVLTAKITWLIDRGVAPSRLFAATFTNKAASEMRERVERFIERPIAGMWIGTFHSLCARILRVECHRIGFESSFSIYDSSDQASLVRKVFQRLEIDDRSVSPRQMLSRISYYKNRCITPAEAQKGATGFYEQEMVRIYTTYQQMLKEQQAMDFDDLLMQTVVLLKNNREAASKYGGRFDYVLVDEYQDTNAAQMELVLLLSRQHNNVFAVGDDDQSIYGWRGAQIENILSFEEHFSGTKVFKLEQNYRSTGAILDFANAAIVGNTNRTEKELWTDQGRGDPVVVRRFRDDRQEAQAVADAIEEECNGKLRGGEIAVLFRTNAQSRVFEEAFRKRQMSYLLVGGTSFYERAEIKDCLAYLRLIVNPYDDISFERIYNMPARGLGEKAYAHLSEIAKTRHSSLLTALIECDPDELGSRFKKGFTLLRDLFVLLRDAAVQNESPHILLSELLQLSGYMDMLSSQNSEEASGRIENINELLNALAVWTEDSGENGRGLAAFLEEVSLVSDIDGWNRKEDAVNLMTLHCAKGLEFRRVYLVGLEEGLLPSRQNLDDDMKIEEERRLLYVGATRAKERLVCSHVDRRYRFGELLPQSRSRFLQAIDPARYVMDDQSRNFGPVPSEKVVERITGKPTVHIRRNDIPVRKRVKEPTVEYDEFSQETVEYRMGQYVIHARYGRGRILSISGFGSDMKLTVLFNDGTRKKLMAKFANFERD